MGGVPLPLVVVVVEMERDEDVVGLMEGPLRMFKGCMSGRLRGGAGEALRWRGPIGRCGLGCIVVDERREGKTKERKETSLQRKDSSGSRPGT